MLALQKTLFNDPIADQSLVETLGAFEYQGKRTERVDREGVPFLFNEYWTARQRQAHSLHEVSYRACFKPQLPAFFINRLTEAGDTVYDPFMGRGTTLVEAGLLGRSVVGNDVNPLSVYLTRPRLNPPTIAQIGKRLSELSWTFDGPIEEDLLAFYERSTLEAIHALRDYLIGREAGGRLDAVDDWIRMVAINRLTGHSTGFFSVYSLPPNQAVTVAAQRKINEKRGQVPPRRDVPAIILKKSKALLKDGATRTIGALLLTGPSDHTPDIKASSVDLVVTSPPFLDIVQYAADNWLRGWFAGIDAKGVKIAMHRKPEAWTAFIRSTFAELGRVVRPGGHVAFEVGEVRGGKVELEKLVLEALEGLPFEPLCVVVNVQEFTKTANCWGVDNNTKGTNTNRIVVVRRT